LAWKWVLQAQLPQARSFFILHLLSQDICCLSILQVPATSYRTPYFTSTQIPGLQLWFDGADLATILFNGTTITQWNDKSGFTRNATSYNSPTYSQTGLNGKGSITFNNSQYFAGSYPSIITGSNLTCFAVGVTNRAMPNNQTYDQRLLSLAVNNTTNDYDNTSSAIGFFNQIFMIFGNLPKRCIYWKQRLTSQNLPFRVQPTVVQMDILNGNAATLTNTASSGNFNIGTFATSERSVLES
jgi:hypothetical protein